jgi:hypothetical protein
MIYYSFDFPYQVIKATRSYRCENFGCYNNIKEEEIYWSVPTQLIVNKKQTWQNLCSKCVQVYLKELMGYLNKKVLNVKCDLGLAEMTIEKSGEGF